jgi:hypothetical protein
VLVVSEGVDPDWEAVAAGTRYERVDAGPVNAFAVPAPAERLAARFAPGLAHRGLLVAQIVLVGAMIVALVLYVALGAGSVERDNLTPFFDGGAPGMLIAARALTGVAGALMLPATLALISSLFTDPRQRATAVATWVTAMSVGIGVGPLAGGLIVNWLRKRNRLLEFWWPAVAAGISVPLLGAFYLATDTGLAYTLLFLAFFFAGSAFAPALACMLVVSEPAMRGTMVALNVLAASVIAYAAAPTYVGFASDFLISRGFDEAGGESLRYALLSSLVLPMLGVFAFLRASRTAVADTVQ